MPGCQTLLSIICVHLYKCSSEQCDLYAYFGQVMNLFGLISPEAAKWKCGLQALKVGGIRMPGSVKHRAALIRSDLRLGHEMRHPVSALLGCSSLSPHLALSTRGT